MSKNRRKSPSFSLSHSPSLSEGSHTRTYTHDSESDSYYSDDFDADSHRSHSPRHAKRSTRRHRKHSPYASDHTISTITAGSEISKKSTQSLGRRQRTKNTISKYGARSQTYSKNNSSKKTARSFLRDSVTSRMLSAKRHKINEITNELAETKQKLGEALKENRLLKTLQHRQDRAIRKFEDTESELPRLIANHSADERVLKAKLRKHKDSERALEQTLREKDEDVSKMERTLRKLKKIVYDKNLGERSELTTQLNDALNRLTAVTRKKEELEKKLELTTSSYNRQLHSELQKHKETKDKLQTLHDEYTRLDQRLKEKERMLDVSNIYSLRQKVSPEKTLALTRGNLDSARSSGGYLHSSGTQTELALLPLSVENGVALSPVTSTPEKHSVKLSRQQQELARQQQELSRQQQKLSRQQQQESPQQQELSRQQQELSRQQQKLSRQPQESSSYVGDDKQHNGSISKRLNELILDENKTTPKESNITSDSKRSIFLTANFSPASSRDNSFTSTSSKSPNADVTTGSVEHKQNDSEQAALDELLIQTKKEEEDEMKRKAEEEQRQKRALLARMREVEGKDSLDLNLVSAPRPPSSTNQQPQKPSTFVDLLFKSENNNSFKKPQQDTDTTSESATKLIPTQDGSKESPLRPRKSYQFSREIENLHRGLPASREGSANNIPDREISFGSYAPTVGTTPARKKALSKKTLLNIPSDSEDADEPLFDLNTGKEKKKPDLLTQLFGEQAAQKPTQQNFQTNRTADQKSLVLPNSKEHNISTTPRAKPLHTSYPWERNIHTHANGDGNLSMTSAPVVKAVPSFNEEDIEEVAL